MSDAEERSPGAMVGQDESDEDRGAREAQQRAEAVAFFEQTVVPGFEAAANAINQQAAIHANSNDAPPRADVQQGPNTDDVMSVELTVRRGGEAEFWFRGMARMHGSPIEWIYQRNPRVKKHGGTITSLGTEGERAWEVSTAETTAEQVRDDLLSRYAAIREALDRQMRR
jgi:hypothetical protein